MKPGDWFNAKAVEDTVTGLNEIAGTFGYAFADINPAYDRDAEKQAMNITFDVGEAPRVYVERIDINGNTVTRDKVIRREFRLNEGDAFNALKVKRSQDRIQSSASSRRSSRSSRPQGSAPDRVVLGVDVEEKSTGELQLSAGYSSLEKFILVGLDRAAQLHGQGPDSSAPGSTSRAIRARSQLGFTEPYLFDKAILLGGDIYRRDYNSFNYDRQRARTRPIADVSTGGGLRLGFPLTEF